MFHTRDVCIPAPHPFVNIAKNTYILSSSFITIAIVEWYLVQTYCQHDLFRWSTPMMMFSFIMVTIFHTWPPLRHSFPCNLIFVVVTMQLMILGAGIITADLELGVLISVIAASAFYVLMLVVAGIVLQENMDANPFCFLTSFFLSMMISAILLYMHIALDTGLVLKLGYIFILYTVSAMIIYHSMVVKSEHMHLFDDDFILMAMLFCVDFICLFLLAAMYFQNDAQGPIKF